MKDNNDSVDPNFTSPTATLTYFRDTQAQDNKKRAVSIRKMLKNYMDTGKTNTRLLLNHIIIIQNDLGVKKTVFALRSFIGDDEINTALNTCFIFLNYINSYVVDVKGNKIPIAVNEDLSNLLREDVYDAD